VKKELSAPKDKQVLTNCSVNESQYFLDNSLLPNNLTGKTSHGKLDNKLDEIRLLKKKTRNVEKAIILFNNSRILETLKFLIKIEAVTSDAVEIKSEHDLGNEQANEFASFLYETTGLDKNKIGEFLGKNKPFNLLVLS